MIKKTLKTKPQLSKESSARIATLLTFDLPSLIEKMKCENTWTNKEYNAVILLERSDNHIVLAKLHEGTKISSFQSNDLITFQIIEGKLMFRTGKESVTLNKGQLLTLNEKIKYSMTTKEETVFLLTISNVN